MYLIFLFKNFFFYKLEIIFDFFFKEILYKIKYIFIQELKKKNICKKRRIVITIIKLVYIYLKNKKNKMNLSLENCKIEKKQKRRFFFVVLLIQHRKKSPIKLRRKKKEAK
jgi:hypothetical protein